MFESSEQLALESRVDRDIRIIVTWPFYEQGYIEYRVHNRRIEL